MCVNSLYLFYYFSPRQDISVLTDGKRKVTRMYFNCSNHQYRNIASRLYSMARGRLTPRQLGCRHAIRVALSVHLVSRIHLSSHFWAFPVNSTTSLTMNTQSQYTLDPTFHMAGRRIHLHTIFQNYHHQTPKAQKEKISCVTLFPMAKCCHQ